MNTITCRCHARDPNGEERVTKRWAGESITFIEDNNQGVWFLHDEAVVISLSITNYDRHILIDNEIMANVLYLNALVQMGLSPDRLEKMSYLLVEFTGDAIPMEGVIALLVKMG